MRQVAEIEDDLTVHACSTCEAVYFA